MIISVNWLKKFTDIDIPVDELATLIGSRLVEIEDIVDLGKKYEGVVVAKVVECDALEGSDHLNITKIDDGRKVQDIERDENGLVQVVCGAPNVRAGLTVAWLPPGSVVPETAGDKEPFVLDARKLRGVMSHGMLASAKELDLFDDHDGILEIDKNVEPGSSFADAYELSDYLLDIENKSLTHRPDTFGIIGFAREVAAIQGKKFKTPLKLQDQDELDWTPKIGDEPTPRVTIDDPKLSARYQSVILTNVDGKVKSPLETQTYLSRVGVKPISAAVDATNYLMLVTGQPMHAFDYDKLKAENNGEIDIHIRGGRDGEKLALLDGREITLTTDDIVIANGDKAVALAGAMGGASTILDENTTSIYLHSANFNLYNLRNTQMRHGIFTEAITRDTKGHPPAVTAPVLAEAISLLTLSTGAQRASDIADVYPGKQDTQPVYAQADHMNAALGSNFSTDDIVTTLENVEFEVTVKDSGVIVATPPYWRADIHISEDLDEEVGRLNGFDSIEPTLPKRDFTAVSPTDFDQLRTKIRQTLARAGANEVVTYSFVHGDTLQKAGQKTEDSYRITNSLSPDLQYYRQTLTPSLLSLVHPNSKAGFDDFALFELNKAQSKATGLNDEGVPIEIDYVALTTVSKKSKGAAYYAAKKMLDYLGSSFGLKFVYTAISEEPGYPESAAYEYRRSAMVNDALSGEYIGIVGEYKKSVSKAFKLPDFAAGFEIDPKGIETAAAKNGLDYRPLSRYPSTERDVCFQVDGGVKYQQIVDAAETALSVSGLETSIEPLDIYQPAEGTIKNITIRIKLTSHDKTLTGEEVQEVIGQTVSAVQSATNATVV